MHIKKRALLTGILVFSTVGITHAQTAETLTDRYREVASRIIGAALTDVDGWEKLS